MVSEEDPRKKEDIPGTEEKEPVSEERNQEEYSFLQETFKDEKGALVKRMIWKFAGLGLVFGLTASLGFFALKPLAERAFYGNPSEVTIPEEDPDDLTSEEVGGTEDEAAFSEFTAENYREMNEALRDIGNEASRCVVEVTGIFSSDAWQEEEYDEKNSVSGMIVADNGPEYLIFAGSGILKDAGRVQVTFVDGRSYDADVKQRDENLGYAVYSVQKSELSDHTIDSISVAVLGSTGTVSQGDTIIALGSPFGYAGAMGFGVVASPENYVGNPDGEYRLVCTDITGAKNGSGVLVNVRGEIVGMIDQRISDEDSMNLVTGYGISDLKEIIEILSNGKPVPYLGVKGVTVTEEISKEHGIPKGIYVQEIRRDSPAMNAGIQSGDVITGIEGEKVETLAGYHALLLKQEVGHAVKVQGMRRGNDGYVEVEYSVTVGSKID